MAREVPGSYKQAFFLKSVLRISGEVRAGGGRIPVMFVGGGRGASGGCDRRLWWVPCGCVVVLDCKDAGELL